MTDSALARFAELHRFHVHLDDEGPPPDAPLLRLYGGPLQVRLGTPRLIANFVTTVDGVTAFGEGSGEGAAAVSLHSAADRFVMALLRTAADCILIGADTLREDSHHQWTPLTPMPDLAEELAAHRLQIAGSASPPPLAVVTASGRLPAEHPALGRPETDVLVITTEIGASQLPPMGPQVTVMVAAVEGAIPSDAIVGAIRTRLAAATVLCEGGPSLFGQLLRGGWVDELFLTIAPQLAGRSPQVDRPGLVRNAIYPPEATPRLALRSLRQSGDHLFLRYAVAAAAEGSRTA